jgi:hypothetical protein
VGEIKVTDKRMFTPDGRLREEFEQELARAAAEPEPAAASAGPEPEPEPEPAPAPAPAAGAAPAPPFTLPPGGEGLKPPTGLLELIQILGDLAASCLGQAPLPDGRLLLDLDGARFYIDLVSALVERFGAAFAPHDRRALDSFLDQLRLQYVARRG